MNSGYNNRGYDRSSYGGQSGYDSSSAGAGAGAGGGYDYSQYYGYYNQGSGEAGGEGKDASNYGKYTQNFMSFDGIINHHGWQLDIINIPTVITPSILQQHLPMQMAPRWCTTIN
jgi:hypothetical protein